MDIIDNKALLIRTSNPEPVTAIIKRSNIVEEASGVYSVLVHWGMDEACSLAKLFNHVPSPIIKEYNWPGIHRPFAHQKKTSEFLTLRQKAFCFSEQGTGKTASAIWAADYLMQKGLVRRALVICPLSIIRSAWQSDLFKFAVHRRVDVAYGERQTRAKVINGSAEFVIINYDGVEIISDAIVSVNNFDLIIVDEASAYKNVQTNRWKALKKIIAPTTRVWMMTGTPAAQSPVDAYGLAKIISPEKLPKYLGQFRDNLMIKVSQFKWVPRPDAEKIVHTVLQPAIRFEKKDCLDLPEVTYTYRDAPLTTQQVKYYKQLKKNMAVTADSEEITALNAAVMMSKLLQISGGAVYADSKEIIEFDVSNRLKVIEEVIEEASHKVLVFVPFTHTLELLHRYLAKNNITSAIINGAVSLNKRSDIFNRFQNTATPRVLLIQPQTAAHGLTLTAANVIVWYAPVTSVEIYLQANARINRPGQANSMTIVHISGSAIESHIYNMLQNKINIHEQIINLYKKVVKET